MGRHVLLPGTGTGTHPFRYWIISLSERLMRTHKHFMLGQANVCVRVRIEHRARRQQLDSGQENRKSVAATA